MREGGRERGGRERGGMARGRGRHRKRYACRFDISCLNPVSLYRRRGARTDAVNVRHGAGEAVLLQVVAAQHVPVAAHVPASAVPTSLSSNPNS